jgi:hypothetical protein
MGLFAIMRAGLLVVLLAMVHQTGPVGVESCHPTPFEGTALAFRVLGMFPGAPATSRDRHLGLLVTTATRPPSLRGGGGRGGAKRSRSTSRQWTVPEPPLAEPLPASGVPVASGVAPPFQSDGMHRLGAENFDDPLGQPMGGAAMDPSAGATAGSEYTGFTGATEQRGESAGAEEEEEEEEEENEFAAGPEEFPDPRLGEDGAEEIGADGKALRVHDMLEELGVFPKRRRTAAKYDDADAPEMAHALGIASRETIEEWRRHVDGPAVAEMIQYASRFRGGLSGRGWSELDVNRLYWGVRYFGSDFQMMQQALFANKTRQELKRKFCTEARRRPWLIDHALQGALEDRNATSHTVTGGPAGAPPDELPPLPPLPLPHMSKRGLDVVRGVATMCGDAADPSHPLNAPPPIPPEFVAASVRRAKASLRRMRDREQLARRDYAEHFPEAEPDPDDPSDMAAEEEGGDAAETVALGEDQPHEASVEASLEASHEASYGSEWSLASTSEGARNLHLDKPWRACAPAAVAPTAGANETSGGVGTGHARALVETGAG